jgi:hypothetical protein
LEGIGNTLGSFIKISEITKAAKYTSYAQICVYMNVAGALSEAVTISYQDNEWSQSVDYEHIPFRCRKCHVHGHLFCDCSMNIKQNDAKKQEGTNAEGFTKIQGKRRGARRQGNQITKEVGIDRNKFKSLEEINPDSEDQIREEPKKQEVNRLDTPMDPDPKEKSRETKEKPDPQGKSMEPKERELEMKDQEDQITKNQDEGDYEIEMEKDERQTKTRKQDHGEQEAMVRNNDQGVEYPGGITEQ